MNAITITLKKTIEKTIVCEVTDEQYHKLMNNEFEIRSKTFNNNPSYVDKEVSQWDDIKLSGNEIVTNIEDSIKFK